MLLFLVSLLLTWTPFAQEAKDIGFDIRANEKLLLGTRHHHGPPVLRRCHHPSAEIAGVFIILPYTRRAESFLSNPSHSSHRDD